MRISLFLILTVATLSLWSQSSQQKYLEAKDLFRTENYSGSIEIFSSLVNDPMFGPYATFYLGLSYHKNGDNQRGLNAWKQLLVKYPTFSQLEEVHFWMSHLFFERGDFDRAVRQAQEIKESETRNALYQKWLASQPFQLVQQLQEKFDEDNDLAEMAVQRAFHAQLSGDEERYIELLKIKFGIALATLIHDDVKKDSYSVAVFLPFLFDDLDSTNRVMRNALVMDLYQGMELASSMLRQSNILLNLFPYDTHRDPVQTEELLRNNSLKEADLIIGPLFPKPVELINIFSQEHEINLINPVSSNSRVVADNPYAFQMKPSYKTMARKAAEFVAANATKNESMIYFEDKTAEKILAEEFRKTIRELGFVVTNFQPIDSKSAQAVLARFSDQEETVLSVTEEEALELIEEGRLVRTREKFDARGNLMTKEDGTPKLEYYELNFTIDTDSLDHIFAATRSNLLANNFVGAVETIPDTVRLIGLGEWLNFSMLDYHQLERLNVNLINSQYFDRSSDFYIQVQEMCNQQYSTQLTIYHMLGFECVWWAGQMMSRYGKYFQNGFYEEQTFPSLFYGHKYEEGMNDNQIVPIVQFTNRKLKAINLSDESSKE